LAFLKLLALRAGLPGKEEKFALHPLSPPIGRGLREVPPVKATPQKKSLGELTLNE